MLYLNTTNFGDLNTINQYVIIFSLCEIQNVLYIFIYVYYIYLKFKL